MIRTGVLGVSEGNGHPFSFSAIVNGYDDEAFARAGWPGIHDYLRRQPPERFGAAGAAITCAWTQDAETTRRLCEACRIPSACAQPEEMLEAVDAVIIARDDWESHAALALPFLERGVAVFVDKPLSLDESELLRFAPWLEQGRLMSCSGLRFAAELDPLRSPDGRAEIGDVKLITGVVLNGLEQYGIHLIEAVASLGGVFARPALAARLPARHDALLLRFPDGTPFQLHCLGAVARTFHLGVFGERGHRHVDLHDNFSAFRRMLDAFFAMVATRQPPIDPDETLRLVRLVAQARRTEPCHA